MCDMHLKVDCWVIGCLRRHLLNHVVLSFQWNLMNRFGKKRTESRQRTVVLRRFSWMRSSSNSTHYWKISKIVQLSLSYNPVYNTYIPSIEWILIGKKDAWRPESFAMIFSVFFIPSIDRSLRPTYTIEPIHIIIIIVTDWTSSLILTQNVIVGLSHNNKIAVVR